MDPGCIYLYNVLRPNVRVLETFAGPCGQSRVLYQQKVPYLEGGRMPGAVTPSQLTLWIMFQVSSRRVSQVLPLFQPIPYGALVLLWKTGFEERLPWNSSWGV